MTPPPAPPILPQDAHDARRDRLILLLSLAAVVSAAVALASLLALSRQVTESRAVSRLLHDDLILIQQGGDAQSAPVLTSLADIKADLGKLQASDREIRKDLAEGQPLEIPVAGHN